MAAAGTESVCPAGWVSTPRGPGAKAKNSRPVASLLDTESTTTLTVVVVIAAVAMSVSSGIELIVSKILDNVDAGWTVDVVSPPTTDVGSVEAGFVYPTFKAGFGYPTFKALFDPE